MALKKREKKLLKILAGVAIVSAIILIKNYAGSKKSEPEVISEASEEIPEEKKETSKTYSSHKSNGGGRRGSSSGGTPVYSVKMKDFKQHTKINDCWVIIDGEVYDISGFFKKYPNYTEKASRFCGTVGFEAGFLQENKIRDSVKSFSQKKGKIS